ncbi:PIR protein [Plasmodium ovale]|uniref:PIR protein n=1 Tax=Plasmodium ovale TaxID=36330 RepID=A0A1D3JES9_PLAOA|nr:PIR protein [Plasmodium ovale]
MAETDHDLQGLPSFYNYRKLDNVILYEADDDSNKCNELSTTIKKYDGVHDLCRKLSYFLRNLGKLYLVNNFENEDCEYLNYWTYDRLFNRIIKDKNHEEFPFISTEVLVRAGNHQNNSKEICKFHMFSIDKVNFGKMKVLFDLAVNYDSIKHKFSDTDFRCSKSFDSYINDSVQAYLDAKAECSSFNEKMYCKVYNILKGLDSKGELPKLKCPRLKESESDLTMTDAKESRGAHLTDQNSLRRHFATYSDEDSANEMLYNDNTETKTHIMVVLFPLMGLLPIFYILYKFSPLGSSLMSLLQNKKNTWNNLNENESKILLENTLNSEDIMFTPEHYLGYHPS